MVCILYYCYIYHYVIQRVDTRVSENPKTGYLAYLKIRDPGYPKLRSTWKVETKNMVFGFSGSPGTRFLGNLGTWVPGFKFFRISTSLVNKNNTTTAECSYILCPINNMKAYLIVVHKVSVKSILKMHTQKYG